VGAHRVGTQASSSPCETRKGSALHLDRRRSPLGLPRISLGANPGLVAGVRGHCRPTLCVRLWLL
jgi:hypothetical protein